MIGCRYKRLGRSQAWSPVSRPVAALSNGHCFIGHTMEYHYKEPNFDAIPQALKDIDRWVTWRAERTTQTEKPRKIPYDAKLPQSKASSTDADTWASFAQAEAAYYDGDRTGVGFVLNQDGIVGVDIDNCITDGVIDPNALAMIEWLGAKHIERSPSGTGLRTFGYAPPLERGVKGKIENLEVELYSTGRYLTVTGDVIAQGDLVALEHFDELADMLRTVKVIDQSTGEVITGEKNDYHAELIRRVLTGDVYHDSLRDLAASFISNNMYGGAAVEQLRALMKASNSEHDDRWQARYNQIPALVRSAQEKFTPTQFDMPKDIQEIEQTLAEKLGVVCAADLPSEFTPPDELVQGLITCESSSVFYGDSNSGKTFLAVDLSCAVSLGREWMGRKTEQGLVCYLATESANSVLTRMKAYQKYHNVTLTDMYVFTTPVNFFRDSADVMNVVQMLKNIEQQRGAKFKLVVSDTLARIASGANENNGTDMAPVMERFDYLAKQTGAHSLTIHHSGKDAAKGARGWSGIRAHIDTEIEIIEHEEGIRVAEITKQRELAGKNTEIAFKLEVVALGLTKWGDEATTCVVLPAEKCDIPDNKKEPKKIINAKQSFEGALLKYGYIDQDGDLYVTADNWNEYTVLVNKASEAARRQSYSRAKKDLVEAGMIAEKRSGYATMNHEAWAGLKLVMGKK